MFYVTVWFSCWNVWRHLLNVLVPHGASFLFEGEVWRHAMRSESITSSVPRNCEGRCSPVGTDHRNYRFHRDMCRRRKKLWGTRERQNRCFSLLRGRMRNFDVTKCIRILKDKFGKGWRLWCCQYQDNLASNVRIVHELCVRKHIERSGRDQIEILSLYLRGGIVREKRRWAVFRPRFEPNVSRMQVGRFFTTPTNSVSAVRLLFHIATCMCVWL
jgi:hypothetical protein